MDIVRVFAHNLKNIGHKRAFLRRNLPKCVECIEPTLVQ